MMYLQWLFLQFFHSDKPVLFPDITYSFYDVWADLYRIPYECQPLDENFNWKKEDYLKENGGIVLANPQCTYRNRSASSTDRRSDRSQSGTAL